MPFFRLVFSKHKTFTFIHFYINIILLVVLNSFKMRPNEYFHLVKH